jgi:hypothetical protein
MKLKKFVLLTIITPLGVLSGAPFPVGTPNNQYQRHTIKAAINRCK